MLRKWAQRFKSRAPEVSFCCITRCPGLQSCWKNKDLSRIPSPFRETLFFFFLQALTQHSMAQSQKKNFPGQKPHPQVKMWLRFPSSPLVRTPEYSSVTTSKHATSFLTSSWLSLTRYPPPSPVSVHWGKADLLSWGKTTETQPFLPSRKKLHFAKSSDFKQFCLFIQLEKN